MKKLLIPCTMLLIFSLSACTHDPSPLKIPHGNSEAITTECSIPAYEEIQEPEEETTESCSQPGMESSTLETASITGESLNTTEPVATDIPPTTETEDQSVVETPSATETQKPTSPMLDETEPVETKPLETAPEETTELPATEPSKPEFDIDYWVFYAGSYAQSVGLTLNAEAIWCWDNPIVAAAHCLYLEQDIQSRLNRYARDEDITDVWIWAETSGECRYNLYIGYA